MGSTGFFAGRDLRRNDLKDILQREIGPDFRLVSIKSNIAWASHEGVTKPEYRNFILAILYEYSAKTGELIYKVIGEDEGPCRLDCPIGLLSAPCQTTNEYSEAWRAKALAYGESVRAQQGLKPMEGDSVEIGDHRVFVVVGRKGRTLFVTQGENPSIYRLSMKLVKSCTQKAGQHLQLQDVGAGGFQ